MELGVVGGFCGLVGVVLFVASIRNHFSNRAWLKGTTSTQGRIVDMDTDGDVPTIEFEDETGRTHRIVAKSNTAHHVGDARRVYYHPGRADEARVAEDLFNSTILTAIMATLFVLTAIGLAVAGLLTSS